jgi:tetratricopeptide (TPR) repeat protein
MTATRLASTLAWATLVGSCATAPRGRANDEAGRAEASDEGWRALVAGDEAAAARAFAARLAGAPDDLLARFGRATLEYEHGQAGAALDDYLNVAATAAAAPADPASWAARVAPVAVARALGLLDEVERPRADRAETALLALSSDGRLPWPARLDLARLDARAARRRGDAARLERVARARGCARELVDVGSAGGLPYGDLDAPFAAPRAAEWRPVLASGCRLSVRARDGQATAEVLRAAVDVPGGDYELVFDYDGEARLALDGGPALGHGSAETWGPRVSAFAATLPPGRHDLEIRVATLGGRAELGLVLLPRVSGRGGRFVDPRAGGAVAARGTLTSARGGDGRGAVAPHELLRAYCGAFVADRVGASDEASRLAEFLAARDGFAAGLALAADVARDDPTRPAGFTRDAARARLRLTVAADPGDARAWQALSGIDLEDERQREAVDDAREATRQAPTWWIPEVVLSHALRGRGLEWDADRALDRAVDKGGGEAAGPPMLVEALLRRAEERRDVAGEARLEAALAAADATSEVRLDRLRARGERGALAVALRALLRLAPERDDLAGELAQALVARGQPAEALAEIAGRVAADPRDPFLRARLADLQAAAGQRTAARETIREALALRPESPDVRRVARAMAVPLPLDAYRLDGRAVIRAFAASGRAYEAPAVLVLDRTVGRVFPDGAQMILTHQIVRVQSKDAIDRWAEVQVPPGAEVLTLRTHKPDGTTREPEDIAGKETVSAANVAIGDFIEWETLETRGASPAFRPGFLGERFFFQSFEAPLDRSEYVLVTPRAMALTFDRRGGAPAPVVADAPDGARVTTFAATRAGQLFVERAAVPPVEYVPSVRVACGVTFARWARYVAEQLHGTARTSAAVAETAAKLLAAAGGASSGRGARATALVRWVTDNIEDGEDLRDPATLTLARGRGNRPALVLALSRELGVPARQVLARSRLTAEAAAPTPVEELDDFSESVIELDVGAPNGPRKTIDVDLRLKHAPFGYLPPSLDGARTLSLPDGVFGVARSTGSADRRSVDVSIRLDEQGGGVAVATEELTGWPALEWAELVDRLGADRSRLRQDFEQRWLGVQFPGARLRDLDVDLPKDAPGTSPVRVRYSFVSPQLAVRGDHEMKLLPTFFRSQPGRRFATEARRSTTLMLGFDVPVHLRATVEFPRAADLVEATPGVPGGGVDRVERAGGYHFVEERRLRAGSPEVLVLTRDSAMPLERVTPRDYAGVAADLRRVDGIEQQEIRVRLRGPRGAP